MTFIFLCASGKLWTILKIFLGETENKLNHGPSTLVCNNIIRRPKCLFWEYKGQIEAIKDKVVSVLTSLTLLKYLKYPVLCTSLCF